MIELIKKNRYKAAIVLSLSIVFFSLVVSLTYSKFHATSEIGASTRVGFFLGDRFESVPVNLNLAPDEYDEIAIDITDRDGVKQIETAMRYTIQLESYGSLPVDYELYKEGEKLDFQNNKIEGTMNLGSQQPQVHSYSLRIFWPKEERNAVNENNLEAIRLNLRAEQID
ncbi:hypothetical protein [Candidatus Enterococcus ferrettii]|uniref:Uncharacterized protein n=1 Tax=Candidatus Enterococcus ferrettii TaxID=2815324 RepID=A0ABV0EMN0_9ENTE|nr:hypothetical protein [Enterococcus sp. 665A]MBO1339735.1 hypothetical protein [Enterococcus sp. 665A]